MLGAPGVEAESEPEARTSVGCRYDAHAPSRKDGRAGASGTINCGTIDAALYGQVRVRIQLRENDPISDDTIRSEVYYSSRVGSDWNFSFPRVKCNTESGNEELYVRIQIQRYSLDPIFGGWKPSNWSAWDYSNDYSYNCTGPRI